jgi:DNA-directed RNA polymerase subunit RPC12/RpoP
MAKRQVVINDKDKVDVKAEISKFMDSDVAGKGKVSQILKDIKEGKPIGGIDLECPGCKNGKDGHVHKLEKKEGVLKCTGPECSKEYILVDKNVLSDKKAKTGYVCKDCGLPHAKPSKATDDDHCTNCGKAEFVI